METKQIEEKAVEILSQMNFSAQVTVSREEDSQGKKYFRVKISGNDLGLIIGYRGRTLKSIQYILSLSINKGQEEPVPVIVDINDYWENREQTLEKTVDYFIHKMKENNEREYDMRPMDARERKIVHEYVAGLEGIETRSEGDERDRHIVLVAV